MTLKNFIDTHIKGRGYPTFDYFDNHSSVSSTENLSGIELQYLENGYKIYKEKNMDINDYTLHTYFFYDGVLSLKTTEYCDTNEIKYDFYKEEILWKTSFYNCEKISSITEYNREGKTVYRINFPLSSIDKISGYIYRDGKRQPMSLFELEKYI